MAYLSPTELATHLYQEQIDVISREDDTLVLSAIDAAISEARGYLSAYDTERLFSAEGSERDALLLLHVKDIAVWHFITLCNAGCDLELRKFRYERAISWLESVQRSKITPNLPQVDQDGDGTPDTPAVYLHGSNPKRRNHY